MYIIGHLKEEHPFIWQAACELHILAERLGSIRQFAELCGKFTAAELVFQCGRNLADLCRKVRDEETEAAEMVTPEIIRQQHVAIGDLVGASVAEALFSQRFGLKVWLAVKKWPEQLEGPEAGVREIRKECRELAKALPRYNVYAAHAEIDIEIRALADRINELALATPPAVEGVEQMSPVARAIAWLWDRAKKTGRLPTNDEVLLAIPGTNKPALYRDPAYKPARRAIKQMLVLSIPSGSKEHGNVDAIDEDE